VKVGYLFEPFTNEEIAKQICCILELSLKSGHQGARMASFSIIGHETPNWE